MTEVVVAYKLLLDLANSHPDLGFTVNQLLRAAVWASVCLILCGLFLGPLGILVGGIAGSCVAYAKSKSFKPLWMILRHMSESEKKALGEKMIRICKERGIDVATASTSLLSIEIGRQLLRDVLQHVNKR